MLKDISCKRYFIIAHSFDNYKMVIQLLKKVIILEVGLSQYTFDNQIFSNLSQRAFEVRTKKTKKSLAFKLVIKKH